MTELGIDLDNFSCVGNTTYSYISEDKDQIIRVTANSMEDLFNIKCQGDNLKIPNIFWNPKLHKNP